MFDFITVIGSIIDAMVLEIGVRILLMFMIEAVCVRFYVKMCEITKSDQLHPMCVIMEKKKKRFFCVIISKLVKT